nr:unnamed protein product [Callosobruchus chinensis]
MNKPEYYRFYDNIIKLTSYLTNRKQGVVVNEKISTTASVLNVVPQGSVLGAVLFVLYLNDPPSSFMHDNCITCLT